MENLIIYWQSVLLLQLFAIKYSAFVYKMENSLLNALER